MASADRVVRITLNGEPRRLVVAAHTTLVEALRGPLEHTGTKQGCDRGECGACTVLVDDAPVLSCLTLAALCDGKAVRTVEGLRAGAKLHRLQEAFVRHNAAQCGFCTPGILMSAAHLLESRPADAPPLTRDDVARALSGNLCRCTGYVKILDAVIDAAQGREQP